MAEGQKGSSSACTGEIHSSLVQARDIIVQLLNGVASSPQTQANAILPRPTEPAESAQNMQPSVTSVTRPVNMNIHNNGHRQGQDRAIEEHRRLFGFSVGTGTKSTSGKQSRNKGKSSKRAKCATWTHAFVCLRKKSQFCLPSPQERYELKCTGLGEKKITIEMENKGFEELYRVLLEEFPLLSNAGGIDLM